MKAIEVGAKSYICLFQPTLICKPLFLNFCKPLFLDLYIYNEQVRASFEAEKKNAYP